MDNKVNNTTANNTVKKEKTLPEKIWKIFAFVVIVGIAVFVTIFKAFWWLFFELLGVTDDENYNREMDRLNSERAIRRYCGIEDPFDPGNFN